MTTKRIFAGIILLIIGIGIAASLFNPIVCKIDNNETNLRVIETALTLFHLDTGRYPNNEEALNILLAKNYLKEIAGYNINGYLEELPKDKWGNPYHYYRYALESKEVVINIWSFGADSLPYGEGEGSDVYRTMHLPNQ